MASNIGEIDRYYGPGAGAKAGKDEPAPGQNGATYIPVGGALNGPNGIAFDAQGPPQNLYVANGTGKQILEYANTGTNATVLIDKLGAQPQGVTFDSGGALYFSMWDTPAGSPHEVDKFASGTLTTYASKELSAPVGVIWGGTPTNLFVADTTNNKVVEYQDNNGVGKVVSDPWTKVSSPEYEAIGVVIS